MDDCIHLVPGVSCNVCVWDPEAEKWVVKIAPPKKPKPRKSRQKPKRKADRDPAVVQLMQYVSGMRCTECKTLRTGNAKQCDHERMEIAEKHISEIEAWMANNPEVKGKLVETAAGSAIARVTLRAGLRSAPSPIEGMSLGGLIGTAVRCGNGRAMEWRDSRPSGDPLPV